MNTDGLHLGRRRDRAALVAVLALAAGACVGCGTSDITASRLDPAVGDAVTHLYQRQLQVLNRPAPEDSWVDARAACRRRGAQPDDRGAGADWSCAVTWNDASGAAVAAQFDLDVKANGCYTATGPAAAVGQAVLRGPDGRGRVNPLFQFEGCLGAS